MSGVTLLAVVFAVTFVAELPDKSLFASLLLSVRFRPWPVWLGAIAAFGVHVVLAVTAGSLLTLAPHRIVELITAALFLGGALWLWRSGSPSDDEPGQDSARAGAAPSGPLRIWATSFTVVFIGEWGDITQVAMASFAARYHDPLMVGAGAALGLWAVSGLAVFVGPKVLGLLPERWVRLAGAIALAGFGAYSLIQALQS